MTILRTSMLKSCRLRSSASLWNQRKIEGLACNVCHLATTAALWKQKGIQNSANSAFPHPAHSMHTDPIHPRIPSTTDVPPEDNEVRWRFPVDAKTEDMIMLIQHGFYSLGFSMTFNAVKPITHELMEEALNILYDKVESLRICFRFRHNQRWVADMPRRQLDFKSVNGNDVRTQLSELSNSSFDLHNGPLWKVQLMTSPEDTPCHFPEVKAAFPYQYSFLISLHHAANDGRIMMLISELLHGIIDSLLQGLPVDSQEIGELRDGTEVRKEECRIKAALENDPPKLKAALQELELTRHVPLLIEAFGTVSEANPITYNSSPVNIDNKIMRRIGHKCRSLGVSTNACMTAVFNTTLVDVVRDAGLKRSNYLISSVHPVDGRRLMGKSTKPYLGYHGIPLIQTTATPHNVKNHFWDYVKQLGTELSEKLKKNYMCEQRVVNALLQSQDSTHKGQYTHRMPVCYDYLFSNVYSPFASPGGIGTSVQITSISPLVAIDKQSFPVAYGLIGVRGAAALELTHSTATITREVANRLLDKTVAVFHDIS